MQKSWQRYLHGLGKRPQGIKGNEEANRLCKEASILGHEAEGVVTPAGLSTPGHSGKSRDFDTLLLFFFFFFFFFQIH